MGLSSLAKRNKLRRAFLRDEGQPVKQIGNKRNYEKVMELQVGVATCSNFSNLAIAKASKKN